MKLEKFAATGRFPGVYVHPSRGPVGATDGSAFVVLGATTITEAREILAQCPDPDGAPGLAAIDAVWASAEREARPSCVEISRSTEPDPVLRERALAALAERLLKEDREYGAAVARLERALAEKRDIGDARERLANAKASAKEARRQLERADPAACHAVRVGAAAVDLRLVRRCLAALGATSGTLSAGGALDVTVLVAKGIALVMPFRQ